MRSLLVVGLTSDMYMDIMDPSSKEMAPQPRYNQEFYIQRVMKDRTK